MEYWKYANVICWSLYAIYVAIVMGSYYFSQNILLSVFGVLAGGGISLFTIPKYINSWQTKGHLSAFGAAMTNEIKTKAENCTTLPFREINIAGIGKEEDFNELEEIDESKQKLRVFLLKENTNEMKKKISLIIGQNFMPKMAKRKLMSIEALDALKFFVALDNVNDNQVRYELKKYIAEKSKTDCEFKRWYDKWDRVSKALPTNKTAKNPLYQFVAPKLESLSSDKTLRKNVVPEIDFIIEKLAAGQLPIVYIDVFHGNPTKDEEGKRCSQHIYQCRNFLKIYKNLVIASRGRNNRVNVWIANALNKRGSRDKFPLEKDSWHFDSDESVTVLWSILEKQI